MDDLTIMQFFNNVKNHVECKQHFKSQDAKYLEDMIKELGYKKVSRSFHHPPARTLMQRAYSTGTSCIIYEMDDYRIKFTFYKNGRIHMTWIGFCKKQAPPNAR